MARTAILRAPDDEIIWTWYNLLVDSVKSHTVIVPKNNTNGNKRNSLVIYDTRVQIRESLNKTTIFFKSGFYLQIFK